MTKQDTNPILLGFSGWQDYLQELEGGQCEKEMIQRGERYVLPDPSTRVWVLPSEEAWFSKQRKFRSQKGAAAGCGELGVRRKSG